MTRRVGLALLTITLFGCLPAPLRWLGSKRERVETLWDFAPSDASLGAVFHERAFARAFALWASLSEHPTARPGKKESPSKRDSTFPPLATLADCERAGLDPALDGAVFAWPDASRGALLVVPLRDRAAFRTAFQARTETRGSREIDELKNGYLCATVVERLICAKSLADIDRAAAAHSSPLGYRGEHLGASDTGDVEILAIKTAPQVADAAKRAKALGKVSGVATSIRLRDDGLSLRIHVLGEMLSPLAESLAGAPPPAGEPPAAGARSVIRAHFDPTVVSAEAKSMNEALKHELVEQLTGVVEATTSGRGLLGAHATLGLKDPARVLAYVKKACREAGGVASALRSVTVTDHGCSALFDPKILIVSVLREPVPVSAEVHGDELVLTAGGAEPPTASERTTEGVIADSDAAFALSSAQALVAFTQSPFLGPDTGAGAALKKLSPFVTDAVADGVDTFNDLAAHVAQAFIAGRVAEDGIVITAAFSTFAHDPPEARAAYDAALGARAAGDLTGYHARLAEIERRLPGSLAARRASIVRTGGPFLGAGAFGFGALGAWFDVLGSVIELRPSK